MFEDDSAQRSLERLKDYLGYRGARSGEGGGMVADKEQGCFKIESEVSKWRAEAQHVTMGCPLINLFSTLSYFVKFI